MLGTQRIDTRAYSLTYSLLWFIRFLQLTELTSVHEIKFMELTNVNKSSLNFITLDFILLLLVLIWPGIFVLKNNPSIQFRTNTLIFNTIMVMNYQIM